MKFTKDDFNLAAAKKFDQEDDLKKLREEFCFPEIAKGKPSLYFAGHSLGLRPKITEKYINEELEAWAKFGVEGHFSAKRPWLPYHEFVNESLAKMAGAKNSEVVAMNSLTANLHLMLVSFYRPTKTRFKILIENNTFPADKYAVDSQARFHGFDPRQAILEFKPEPGELTVRHEKIIETIQANKDNLSLVLLGNCNYLSGQYFDIPSITNAAHEVGAFCGFNLAHGMGNLLLKLHDWNCDFAVWCSYKYLNAGPGGIAGAFVHEKFHNDPKIPRFEGWWGTNKEKRFQMLPQFEAIPTAEAWQLSNPPIFQLASLRASLDLFDQATMPKLVQKRNKLTLYLQALIENKLSQQVEIVTPGFDLSAQTRGAMLCVRIKDKGRNLTEWLMKQGALVDFREPNIIRIAPVPIYCNFSDVFLLTELMEQFFKENL